MRSALVVVWIALAGVLCAGCYASHTRDAPDDVGGELCARPADPGGSPCDSSFPVIPEGVCRLADGTTIAFATLEREASCWREDDGPVADGVGFEPHSCAMPIPRGRVVASCGVTSDTPTFAGRDRPSGSGAMEIDLTTASCALARPTDGEPREPRAPFVEADLLCSDPHAWCGSPIVLELRQEDGDGCNGAGFTHRCTARVEAGRVVLHAEGAREMLDGCETAVADRVARCIVPPLPAGRYEVFDAAERRLGEIAVPAARPTGELEPTCTPI